MPMRLREAVLLTIEGACDVLAVWRQKLQEKSDILKKIDRLAHELDSISKIDFPSARLLEFYKNLGSLQMEVFGKLVNFHSISCHNQECRKTFILPAPSKMPEDIDFYCSVCNLELGFVAPATAPCADEPKQLEAAAEDSWFSIAYQVVTLGYQTEQRSGKTCELAKQTRLRKLKNQLQEELTKLDTHAKEEHREIHSLIKKKEHRIQKGRNMFYGLLSVESNMNAPSTETAFVCLEVCDLVRENDIGAGLACVALGDLLEWYEEVEKKFKHVEKKNVDSWKNVKEWENIKFKDEALALLNAGACDFTEVNILAMHAADADEDMFKKAPNIHDALNDNVTRHSIEILRQVLCMPLQVCKILDLVDVPNQTQSQSREVALPPPTITYVFRSHVRKMIVKERNQRATWYNRELPQDSPNKMAMLAEDSEWPTIKKPQILRALLHALRNSLRPYFVAVQTLEVLKASPLDLRRRQAVNNIGEMAHHGNHYAADYLLDHLCTSDDSSVKQIALARSARLLPKANARDLYDITRKLLCAALSKTEHGIVQETAETSLINALKGGMNRKPAYVDLLLKIGNSHMQRIPRSSPEWDTWARIQAEGFQRVAAQQKKEMQTQHFSMRFYREKLKAADEKMIRIL